MKDVHQHQIIINGRPFRLTDFGLNSAQFRENHLMREGELVYMDMNGSKPDDKPTMYMISVFGDDLMEIYHELMNFINNPNQMNIETHQRHINGETYSILKFSVWMYDRTYADGNRFCGKLEWENKDSREIVQRTFESPTFMGAYDQMIQYLKTTAI